MVNIIVDFVVILSFSVAVSPHVKTYVWCHIIEL